MIVFAGTSADQVWRAAAVKLRETAPVQEGRDQPTRELLHAAFSIQQPRQRVVFGRVINPAFALAEVLWILAGANSVDFLRFWNPRMKRFSDDGTRFHGAYGYRLGCQPRLDAHIRDALIPDPADRRERADQLRMAYEALRETPTSRQVVLQIWDGERDLPDPQPRSKDIPCNLMSHLLVRDNKLEWLQVMRSNDLIWGTPYNFIQWTSMQEIVAGWLGIEPGTYTHISDSLHVYQRHWDDLDQITPAAPDLPENTTKLALPYGEWEQVWNALLDVALHLTQARTVEAIRAAAHLLHDMPPGYQQWGAVLAAEALRRRGFPDEALAQIDAAGPYWRASWQQWYAQQTQPQEGEA